MNSAGDPERTTAPPSDAGPRREATWLLKAAVGACCLLFFTASITALRLRDHGRFPETFWPMGVLDLLLATLVLAMALNWRRGSFRTRSRAVRYAVMSVALLLVLFGVLRAVARLLD